MNKLTEPDKAYLAGFFDGEGCISISKFQGKNNRTPVYQLQVAVSQKSNVLVDLCQMSGLGTIFHNPIQGVYQWRLSPREGAELLEAIYPYLRNKSVEAQIAIEYQSRQGHKNSGGKGWTVPQELIDEKESYYQRLREIKGKSGANGGRGRKRAEGK